MRNFDLAKSTTLHMHELSIIYSIIESAEAETKQRPEAGAITAIELDIGALAGVEIGTFEFLWPAAVESTVLEGAECIIHCIPGRARCSDCDTEFPIRQFYDPCPKCGSHLIQITRGEDLRIKSMTLVSHPPGIFSSGEPTWN